MFQCNATHIHYNFTAHSLSTTATPRAPRTTAHAQRPRSAAQHGARTHVEKYGTSAKTIYRLALATRSVSSFFLMAYELDEPFAAFISSSARHSDIDLMLRNACSRLPEVMRASAWREHGAIEMKRNEHATPHRTTVTYQERVRNTPSD